MAGQTIRSFFTLSDYISSFYYLSTPLSSSTFVHSHILVLLVCTEERRADLVCPASERALNELG